MRDSIRKQKLIDRYWEKTSYADRIRKIVIEGIEIAGKDDLAFIDRVLEFLDGSYEVRDRGTTYAEWLQREGYVDLKAANNITPNVSSTALKDGTGIMRKERQVRAEIEGDTLHVWPSEKPNDDHLVAETIGGTSRSGPISGLPIPGESYNPLYKPHAYAGPKDVIGGVCIICGGASPDLVHNATSRATARATTHEILTRTWVSVENMDTQDGRHVNYEFLNLATDEQRDIVLHVLPEVLNKFFAKNVDYQDFDPTADLGPKAHFLGIWRKVVKLKRGLWEGKTLDGEQVSELLDDLIGHALLARLGLREVDRTGPKA